MHGQAGDPTEHDDVVTAVQHALQIAVDAREERALEVTVRYAKDRVQFGRPIGSFRAVKHRLAAMHTAVERPGRSPARQLPPGPRRASRPPRSRPARRPSRTWPGR
ncbi:acyl-CoA dehydrogenase family protein [Streptomyces sp. NPDC006514]|uniref:acyl-CoA dehydrogenase family protein n=1 Tax=Streptomyces sp. NPDC006514 TaxID=3154308 RepID=UPI0033A35BB9